MDTFGRLPSDLLKEIKYLYQTPTFEFIIENQIAYLVVHINSSIIKLKMLVMNHHLWMCYNYNILHNIDNIYNEIMKLDEDSNFSFVLRFSINHYIEISDNVNGYKIYIPRTKETMYALKKSLLKCIALIMDQ